jgi:Rrf2 family protein
MKLTRASSYALHAVAYMAQQKDQTVPVASHHIAKARGIPERFLLKVLKPLVSHRVLSSIKGPNGGYRLAKQPSEISMLEILEAVDGKIQGIAPGAEKSNPSLNNKLDNICQECAEAVRKTLKEVTIAQLMPSKKEIAAEEREAASAASEKDKEKEKAKPKAKPAAKKKD